MIIWQLLDLFLYFRVHLFCLFFLYVWLVWAIKYYFAKQNKPYIDAYTTTTSIIVPVFNEKPEVFEKCLQSLIDNNPDEIVVVMDKDAWDQKIEEIINTKYANVKLVCNKVRGKRPAFIEGVKNSKGEIVVMVDSDTIFPKGTLAELIKPFKDTSVGGATVNVRIFDREKNIIRRFSDWATHICFKIAFPALSSKGVLVVLPGRALAIRRELVLRFAHEFLNDKYRGKNYQLGDDRCLTSLLLRHGYKTVLQPTATVYTDTPETFKGFVKQQLRWYRSNQRYNFAAFKWMHKRHWLYALHVLHVQFTPYLFAFVCLWSLINVIWKICPVLIIQGTIFDTLPVATLLACVSATVSIGLRQSPHLKSSKEDLKFLPLYVIFITFVMIPIFIYAGFTKGKQNWLTR